jgi:hypothetical protein
MIQSSDWVETGLVPAVDEIESDLMGSIQLGKGTKESFYNVMRLEIGYLMDSLDFSILEEKAHKISSLRKAGSRNFKLSPVDMYMETMCSGTGNVDRSNIATLVNSRIESKVRQSTKRSETQALPRSRTSAPALTDRLKISSPNNSVANVVPKQVSRRKKTWIRIEDISEIPEGVLPTLS